MYINKLFKLTREDIENKYLNKPILVHYNDSEEWYIVCENNTTLPLHLLTGEEDILYKQNEENINAIQVIGGSSDSEGGYLLWIYFNNEDGWTAYGYES